MYTLLTVLPWAGVSMSIGKWLDSKGYDVKANTGLSAAARNNQLAAAAAAAAAIPVPQVAGTAASMPPPAPLPAPARHKATRERERDHGKDRDRDGDYVVKDEPGTQREHKRKDRDGAFEAWEPWLDTKKGMHKPIQVRSQQLTAAAATRRELSSLYMQIQAVASSCYQPTVLHWVRHAICGLTWILYRCAGQATAAACVTATSTSAATSLSAATCAA